MERPGDQAARDVVYEADISPIRTGDACREGAVGLAQTSARLARVSGSVTERRQSVRAGNDALSRGAGPRRRGGVSRA